jgi:hypothetical protein
MEIFTDEERIARIYTIRHTPYPEGGKWSRNRHDFLLPNASLMQSVAGCFEPLGLAERHAMLPQVILVSQVALMVPKDTEALENLSAVCSYYQGYGGRIVEAGALVAPFPIVLQLRKMCAYGRSSRLFYEGMLTPSDLKFDDAPRVHLSGSYDWVGLVSSYFNTYMQQCPYPYITLTTPQGANYPSGYRNVLSFAGATAERLTSIPDAQSRKTYKAIPYMIEAQSALAQMQEVGGFADNLAHAGYPYWSEDQRANLLSLVGNFGSTLLEISQYYNEGIKPGDAACWRPTSGLNPFSVRAQATLQHVMNAVAAFGQAVSSLPFQDDYGIAATDFAGALPIFWRACGLYMLFLDDERFTGTPNYIPRGLSQCHAGI